MKTLHLLVSFALLSALPVPSFAQAPGGKKSPKAEGFSPSLFSGLKFRSLGPAVASGRISDLVVDPHNRARWFVAAASGGVWRTQNAGTTFEPIFDKEGSYSIGCLALDPSNPHVIWVGTGENNSQRSVSFGDGVYRSRDGGRHFDNMGLKQSEHIGKILIDPRDSRVVFVAAQGPLWRDGGDRGLYKTEDGGQSWHKVLDISPSTGVNDVVMDPRNPDVLLASAYQRRRHVWTLLDGGPESGLWKSTDGGRSWRKLKHGLPGEDMGRIGLAVSQANPDVVYAIIEAARGAGGFFRSRDRGETWEKRSGYMSTSPQYYNELVCDPKHVDRVYSLDTLLQVTKDGGKTFHPVPGKNKHVDHHVLWIDPSMTSHLIVGCDGGVYETYDQGAHWAFKANLPVTQFYRVGADNARPFYNVFGGTQDNNSLLGPSRTLDRMGIANENWLVTVGGDGYETLADPEDPDILYSLWQYGGLVRFDRQSGERADIKPREAPGEAPLRWNWDSPLIISPHAHTRLYFAANRLFRSDDRGDSWTAVSPDLTRKLDRNRLKIMHRVWSVDAVSKNRSTSFYGTIVSLSESTLVEGLLYVGTDDGLIQVSEDGGENWRREKSFPGIPKRAYVSRIEASRGDADTVFAAFDNHKMGDFKPYLLKSTDRGRTWHSIAGDLPMRHVVHALAQDGQVKDLLFAGTEFGVFFTRDGGLHWTPLKGGLPTIAVRDMEIQRRENDLVLGTFGRGIYILDDYTPLRQVSHELFKQEAFLFPVKDALRYVQRSRLGGRGGRGSQGASFFSAPNPPFGATFTWFLKAKPKTLKEQRKEREKKLKKKGQDVFYPTWDELKQEDRETAPKILLVVKDQDGALVRRLEGPRSKGLQRLTWDLRFPAMTSVKLAKAGAGSRGGGGSGPLVLAGRYSVTLVKLVHGMATKLTQPVAFNVVPLALGKLKAPDPARALAFQQKVANLQRAVRGTLSVANETASRLDLVRQAVLKTPQADPGLLQEVDRLKKRLDELLVKLRGDRTVSRRSEPTPPSISARVENIVGSLMHTTTAPTLTEQESYRAAGQSFAPVLGDLRQLIQADLKKVQDRLEDVQAPWTPGRLPVWKLQ